MMKDVFSKALKVEQEAIKSELLSDVRELTDEVVDVLINEVGVEIKYSDFYSLIVREAEQRNWDLRYFRNAKNEPVSNLFKRVIRNLCKEKNVQLNNDSLSRLLNIVRKHYGDDANLSAGLYPAEAFQNRDSYGIPDDLGDTNSCFRPGGCNEGNALWLIQEDREFNRAKLIVFHYESGSKVGVGRCWAYMVSEHAIYATNFYSTHFEIKEERFKYPVVRLLRKLFNLSENIKFATGRSAPLPIYLNGDSIIIYEPSHYESSDNVLSQMEKVHSICLWCREEVDMFDLVKYEEPVYYSPVERRVQGLIVCKWCQTQLEDSVECYDCGELILRDDAVYIGCGDYVCQDCYEREWFHCDRCGGPIPRSYGVVTSDGRMLCDYCARQVGAFCDYCGEFVYFDDGIEEYSVLEGRWTRRVYLCSHCAEKHLKRYQCQCQCGKKLLYLDRDYMRDATVRDIIRLELCPECYSRRNREIFEFAFENTIQPTLFRFRNVIDEILAMSD